jgi:hypothetical protein
LSTITPGTIWGQPNTSNPRLSKGAVIYFAVGINQSFFSKTDLTFKSQASPSFNFTIENVRGKDDQGFKFDKGAPQYSYSLGFYHHTKEWGIEFNFDHIKYYVRQFQRVHLTGTINHHQYNVDTVLVPEFIQLEHSDGANYALLKWQKWRPIFRKQNHGSMLNLIFKAGGGPVIPKTNSTIMGKHRDDKYTLAGFVIALESGLRYSFSKLLFTEVNVKVAYANYSQFLIADGTGSQRWIGIHPGLLIGIQSF